ncbi:MAG: hypothetical protein II746_03300 [Bacteroidaceae bacterium]|nr:hypothetical protein [Bacteroidaceae bacterium]
MIVNISHKSAAKLHKTIEMPAPFREYFSKKDGVAMEEDSRIEFSIRIAMQDGTRLLCHSDRAKRRKNLTTQQHNSCFYCERQG